MIRWILLSLALALATWYGGNQVDQAYAQVPDGDPCGFWPGQALQNEDGTSGADLICISKPGVYFTNGVTEGSDQVFIVADDVTIYGERTKEGAPVEVDAKTLTEEAALYVQTKARNTTVYGTTTYDYLVNYEGLPARLIAKGGTDVIEEPIGTETTSIAAGAGNDRITTPARSGVVRAGPGRDTCKVRRTVKTFGCERIVRW